MGGERGVVESKEEREKKQETESFFAKCLKIKKYAVKLNEISRELFFV